MIPWFTVDYWGNEEQYVLEALRSKWISGGSFIDKFESKFKNVFQVKNALSVSNGTSALELAFLVLDLKPGDEVIIPGFSFLGAANVAMNYGIRPVFVDVDLDTWLTNSELIEKAITKNTKAIVPIHTYGNICHMPTITQLARDYNLFVIEDCAENAFSTLEDSKYMGTFGDISTFSFQATKTITTGEGGMVVINDENLVEKAWLIRSHGLKTRGSYRHSIPGMNFRLTNVQAAIGLAQMERLEIIREKKYNLCSKYMNYLDGVVKFQQPESGVSELISWAFAVLLPENSPTPDTIRNKMMNLGVEIRPGFTSSSLQNIYYKHRPLINSEYLSNHVISLPSYASIEDKDIEYVCESLLKTIER